MHISYNVLQQLLIQYEYIKQFTHHHIKPDKENTSLSNHNPNTLGNTTENAVNSSELKLTQIKQNTTHKMFDYPENSNN